MASRFLRLDGSAIAGATPLRQERRKTQRKSANGEVHVATSAGDAGSGKLQDFSPYGCNLGCRAEWLRIGRFVTVAFEDIATVEAIVRWARDGVAGLEFLRPLSHGDADAIGATFATQ